jgi:prolyl oligopeptidase family protein
MRAAVVGCVVVLVALALPSVAGAAAPAATSLAGVAAKKKKPAKHKKKPRTRYVADGRLREWRGTPTNLSGYSQISRGELIYTDYLYDDYGPDLDGVPRPPVYRGLGAIVRGDYRYPDNPQRYGYNAADLRELRISATRGGLHALISLQTMKAPDAAIAMLAFDTDGKPATGAVTWPDGAGIDTAGADRFVTAWGTGAHIVDQQGRTHHVRSAVNLTDNAIELDIPYSLLGPLAPNARVWVVTGLFRPDGGGFLTRTPRETAVYNVGFRSNATWDRFVDAWGEHEQGAALARRDVTPFAHGLDLRALRGRRTIPFRPRPGTWYNRVFRSEKDYGEGVVLKNAGRHVQVAGTPDPQFLSRYQPYGLYVPSAYDGRRTTPLLLDGHSLEVNHNEYWAFMRNRVVQLGEQRGSFVLTPLGRGMDTWYLSAGLVDVLEAWEDVRRNYAIDDDRTAVTGYSMGGYMTHRLGLLMPDRFARASAWVGPVAYFFYPWPLPLQTREDWRVAGNMNLLVDNALNLPFEIVNGTVDELVPVGGFMKTVADFTTAGNEFRSYQHALDDHLSFAASDQWGHTQDWLGDERRERNPLRVRYKRYPAMDLPADGLRFDRAYWVSELEVRDASAPDSWGEIDTTTLGRGGHERDVSPPTITQQTVPGNSPATVVDRHFVAGAPIQEANGFRATLRNIGAVRLDLERMGIDPGDPVTGTLAGDGPTILRLTGRFAAGTIARLDGRPVPVGRDPDGVRVTVDLTGGRPDLPQGGLDLTAGGQLHHLVISRAG